MSTIDSTARDTIFVILALIILFSNTVEIILILRCKSKKLFDKLLLSLALSDILVGLAVIAFKSIGLVRHNALPWLEGEDCANIFIISSNFSMSNLIFITVDRFLAVRFPVKHRILLTERRVNTVIALVWFLSAVSTTLFSIIKFEWRGANESLLILSGFLLLIGVAMMVVYIKIFYLISKRTAKGSANTRQGKQGTIRGLGKVTKGPHVTERAVFITGAIVTISFIVCTYPFAFDFLICRSAHEISLPPRLMILLNSLFNPFIYFFKNYLDPKRKK